MNTPQFKNSQLQRDLEKLLGYDNFSYTEITTDYDENLGYILDIKDNSYFYVNEDDRDLDMITLIGVLRYNLLF